MTIEITSETDTVIKRVLPYLQRRGYLLDDLAFEAPTRRQERQNVGYVDLLITLGKSKPSFLIEAKRLGKTLTIKDRDQAISYGTSHKVPFVVVTNGDQIICYNTNTKQPIKWNSTDFEKVPSKDQLAGVLKAFKTDKNLSDISFGPDTSQPYRPGLNPKQLNKLFYKCHSDIRRIEKSEDRAFQDFSKLLFLKLYEEKCDVEGEALPYSWTFAELAEKKDYQADQVRQAVTAMIDKLIADKGYGEVLSDGISLKNDKTYQTIVQRLSEVSFYDSSFDSKGAAFEYYVRATLKGKKLGQYFTPRTVVRLMSSIVGPSKILNAALMSQNLRVVDPACGTGGFLVYLMKEAFAGLQLKLDENEITKSHYKEALNKLQKHTFFGADANESVASAAKMNMIIAGDGQSNIHPEDTLKKACQLWSVDNANCDIVMTNPPFGTSEADSLTASDMRQFPVNTKKGQLLFLQKMTLCANPDEGEICTVIDDGVLNTEVAKGVREWLLKNCKLVAVVSLPLVTFKPNKINVLSSIIYLKRRSKVDHDLESKYPVKFIEVKSLGYNGSGENIRGFTENEFMVGISDYINKGIIPSNQKDWKSSEICISEIIRDPKMRFDVRYWNSDIRKGVSALKSAGQLRLNQLVKEPIRRGKSPSSDSYVDEAQGYALVVKSGSNVSRFGEVLRRGDFLEKNHFEEINAESHIRDGDVLLSSTGTGTLGKSAVYRDLLPAIADSHVSIIRLDQSLFYPEYVCDYLRLGFGAAQIQSLYTGSTGLIEITPDQVASIIIEVPGDISVQKSVSDEWRKIEDKYRHAIDVAEKEFEQSRAQFLTIAPMSVGYANRDISDEEEASVW